MFFFDLGKCWFTYSLDTFLICITSALFSPEGGNRIIPTGCYFDKLSPKYMQKVGHSDTGPHPNKILSIYLIQQRMVFPPTIHDIYLLHRSTFVAHSHFYFHSKKRHALSFAPNLDSAAAAVADVAEISLLIQSSSSCFFHLYLLLLLHYFLATRDSTSKSWKDTWKTSSAVVSCCCPRRRATHPGSSSRCSRASVS